MLKKKKLVTLCLVCGALLPLSAQQTNREKTLTERVSLLEKKSDRFNLYLNMHGTFDAQFNYNGINGLQEGVFKMKQFRMEAKGNIAPWLFYRWRQRLNRSSDGSGNVDNMPTSIDIAGIGIRFDERFSLFMGKQCAAYGGIEFDLNPIEIYEYCDMIENMSNFMTGLNIAFRANEHHQLQLQVLDSRNGSTQDTYGNVATAGIEESPLPLVYTLNWNGAFFNNVLKTRWSASVMNQAKEKQMYYYALGNELTWGKFNMYLDAMYSKEDLDRKGVITGILGSPDDHVALNVAYTSLVAKLNYRVAPKWKLHVKGMYETAGTSKATAAFEKGKYRTSYGYLGGIEYYPLEQSNLHFFANFTGRDYLFTDRAAGFSDFDTQRFSIGFIYQLPLF